MGHPAASEAETRNVKVETGGQRESQSPHPCKTKPQRVRHPLFQHAPAFIVFDDLP